MKRFPLHANISNELQKIILGLDKYIFRMDDGICPAPYSDAGFRISGNELSGSATSKLLS
jgi:hypothetical protein